VKGACALATGVALSFAGAAHAAATPPDWSPGERTTSRLPGEMKDDSEESSLGDGVYGRFQGRYDLGLGAGAELGDGGASLAVRATAHYFFMAGLYAGYAEGFGRGSLPSSRTLSFGVDLRPTFLARWSNDLQHGPSILDLWVDSISIGLGAFFRQPQNQSFGDRRGFELSLGCGIPLAGDMPGPWLGARGILRWDDPEGRGGPSAEGTALLTLGWHWVTDL
jgi:hypothetical protein